MTDQPKPLRIGIWCAVSTPEQAKIEKDSLPAQERDGRAWAEGMNGDVVQVFEVPGHTRKYLFFNEVAEGIPAYRNLREACEAQALDVLWCRNRDRLGRTLALIAQVDGVVREIGKAEVYSAAMPHQIGRASGRGATLMAAFEGWAAEADNEERNAKHHFGMRGRVLKKQLHAGAWPTGYRPVRNGTGQVVGAEFDERIGAVRLATKLFHDGTPHRLPTPTPEQNRRHFTGDRFIGYDMDRTMVRIGWMNMVLHGIENPAIERRDAPSKSVPDTGSGKYDYVLNHMMKGRE